MLTDLSQQPVAQVDPAGIPFAVPHDPKPGVDWIELLASGLAFDCHGLAPGQGRPMPERGALLGLPSEPLGCEAIELTPGPHLADAGAMLPVLRAQIGLGLRLAELPGLAALCWQPARSWMEPAYFRKIAAAWLSGGAFPALGLVSFDVSASGVLRSTGLRFLIGQELQLDGHGQADSAALVRIALRLVHELVQSGPVTAACDLIGPGDERLAARPGAGGTMIEVTLAR